MENFSVLALFHENASISVLAGIKNSPAAPQYMSLDLKVLPTEEISSSILKGNFHRLRLFLNSRPLSPLISVFSSAFSSALQSVEQNLSSTPDRIHLHTAVATPIQLASSQQICRSAGHQQQDSLKKKTGYLRKGANRPSSF